MKAYHFLCDDMRSGEGHEKPWKVGETRTLEGEIVLCERGYHSAPSWYDALLYAPGNVACVVEVSEPDGQDETKYVSRTRTLVAAQNVERELRLWGVECAERALQREREAGREPDPRSWAALEVATRYANGEATKAACTAAWAAAWAAAWTAARAARAAAGAAEEAWQRQRLHERLDAIFAIAPTAEGEEAR